MAVQALLLAGAALQAFGQMQANMAQADAEVRNSKFYREQADFAQAAGIRQAQLADQQYTKLEGDQISAYAKGGIDISGSAAGVIANTASEKIKELQAIKLKTDLDYKLARSRSFESMRNAENLRDPMTNLMQAGGAVLGSGALGKK